MSGFKIVGSREGSTRNPDNCIAYQQLTCGKGSLLCKMPPRLHLWCSLNHLTSNQEASKQKSSEVEQLQVDSKKSEFGRATEREPVLHQTKETLYMAKPAATKAHS